MFLTGLKAKSIIKQIDKAQQARNYKASTTAVSSVAILQDVDKPFDTNHLTKLCKAMGVKTKDVTILEYVKTLTKEQREQPQLFSDKQVGWKGVFKTKSLKDFSATPFDILISYYTPENLSLKAMTALCAAKFKVGIDPAMEIYNDLTIHVATDQEVVFTKELEKYLKILKVIN